MFASVICFSSVKQLGGGVGRDREGERKILGIDSVKSVKYFLSLRIYLCIMLHCSDPHPFICSRYLNTLKFRSLFNKYT